MRSHSIQLLKTIPRFQYEALSWVPDLLKVKDTEQELNSELNAIRKNEIGIEVEEYEYGMMCIAGMIKNSQGKTIASMSISGPTSRIRHKGEKKLTDLVKESCKAVSEKIPF